MQRVFVIFPVGLSGLGLLLLRVAAALTIVFEGRPLLSMLDEPFYLLALLKTAGLLAGALLLIGLCTQIGCAVLAVEIFGIFASSSATCLRAMTPRLLAVDLIVMLLVTAVVGPGAFSLDARLFGRRRIVFPD